MSDKSARNDLFRQAFDEWFKGNANRFSVQTNVHDFGDGQLSFSFLGIHPSIVACLHESGFCAAVELENGEQWDSLIGIDVVSSSTQNGYCDELTLPEYRVYYANKEAFWCAELFEPMLDWINTKLAKAQWIVLYRWGGIQEAALLPDATMQECYGRHVLGVLGGLRSLAGERLRDVVTPVDMESFLLSMRDILRIGDAWIDIEIQAQMFRNLDKKEE